MKIYISLPMAGYTKTVNQRFYKAYEELVNAYGRDTIILGPTNIDDFDDNGLNPAVPTHPWSWHLGEDIKDLLDCDAIYLCQGWFDSKGCRVELAVANARGLKVLKQENADTFLSPETRDDYNKYSLT